MEKSWSWKNPKKSNSLKLLRIFESSKSSFIRSTAVPNPDEIPNPTYTWVDGNLIKHDPREIKHKSTKLDPKLDNENNTEINKDDPEEEPCAKKNRFRSSSDANENGSLKAEASKIKDVLMKASAKIQLLLPSSPKTRKISSK